MGRPRLDLSGRRVGSLLVSHLSGESGKHMVWECRCDCGAVCFVKAGNLNSGNTTSCGCQSSRLKFTGSTNPKWNGGRTVNKDGYVFVLTHGHPRANDGHYVLEHIIVAEKALGQLLPLNAVVHHVNEQKSDNRNGNLVICEDRAYHLLLHARKRAYTATGNTNMRTCGYCGKWDLIENLQFPGNWKNKSGMRHRACQLAYCTARRSSK